MAITHWPLAERPREKLLKHGAQALSDAELLAIFLRTGTRGVSAVDLARHLLTEFGGLRPMLQANQEAFCQRKGLGTAKYVSLQAMMEMSRRCMLESLQRDRRLTDPAEVKHYLQAQLRDETREVFSGLFLDARLQVIAYEPLFYGTLNTASIYPREVVKRCLAHNAASVIFAHNHPSGIAVPSQADKMITHRLMVALSMIDMDVLDHFIIGEQQIFSFAEHGLLDLDMMDDDALNDQGVTHKNPRGDTINDTMQPRRVRQS